MVVILLFSLLRETEHAVLSPPPSSQLCPYSHSHVELSNINAPCSYLVFCVDCVTFTVLHYLATTSARFVSVMVKMSDLHRHVVHLQSRVLFVSRQVWVLIDHR